MIIHNAAITGSLTLNGIDISDITGSEAGVGALNNFSASINNYTSSNNANITALNAQTASILSYTSSNDARLTALNAQTASILSYTSSNDARIAAIYTATSSLNASVSALNAQSASLLSYTSSNDARINALNSFSSSILSYTSSTDAKISAVYGATSSLQSATSSLNAFSGSILSYTSSTDAKIASIYTTTSSLNASVSSLNTYTSSLNAKTASFATTGSNTFTGQQYISNASQASNFTSTASFYTDGGARITKDMYVSGTAYFNNITVFGTQSVSYISSSQLNIGTNLITVNTDTPSIRFGGLAVYDSGSTGLTGSILWDSQNNHWVYSNPSGSSYSGGMFISGPRSAALGSEQGTTLNSLMKGQGGDHMTSSAVFDVSGSVGIGTSSPAYTLDVQGIYGQSTTSTQPFVIYGDSGDTNGLFRIQMDSISDSFGTGARTFLGDGGIDLFLGTANSTYTPNNTYIALNYSGEISMGAGSATKHLVINTSGNVGIGTSTPTTRLHVSGTIGGIFEVDGASAINALYVSASGQVGIGNTTPSNTLDVTGTGRFSDGTQGLVIRAYTGTDGWGAIYPVGVTPNTTNYTLIAKSANAVLNAATSVTLAVGDSGKLTANSTGISVTGTSTFSGNIITTGATAEIMANGAGSSNTVGGSSRFTILDSLNTRGWILQQNASYNLSFWHFNGGWSNVINFTPAGAATFSSTIAATSATFNSDFLTNETSKVGISFASGYGQINSWGANTSTYGGLKFQLSVSNGATTTPLIILPSGNIGIGTTSPGVKLYVSASDADYATIIKNTNTSGYGLQVLTAGSSTNLAFQVRTNNASTNAFQVLDNGNVGIGTTNPTSAGGTALVIYDSTTARTYWKNSSTNTYGGGVAQFNDDFYIFNSETGGNIYFQDSVSTRLTLASGGNVGIGTTSPQSGVILDIRGAGAVAGGSEGLRIGNVGDNSAYDNVKLYYTGFNGGSPRVYLTPRTTPGSGVINTFFHLQNSNGTSTSSNNTMGLIVDGTIAGGGNFELTNSGGPYVLVGEGTGVNQYAAIDWDATNNRLRIATQPFAFGANGGQITLTTGGNVGIGTTNPVYRLDVVGNVAISGRTIFGMSPSPFWNARFADYSDGSGVYISSVQAGGYKAISGNSYYNNSGFWYSDNTVSSIISFDSATIKFYTNSGLTANTDFIPSERMRITSGGNVGIGTTSPGQLLEVVGGEIKAGRVNSSEEGGQVSFGRASDNATGYYIDVYGSTSTPELRFVDVSNNAVRMSITSGGTLKMASTTISNNNAVFAAGELGGYKYFQGTLANGEKFGSQGGTYVLGFYFITWFDGSSSRGYAMYATTNPTANAGTVLISSGGTYTASATYNASSAVSLAFDGSSRGAVLSNNTGVSLTFYSYVFGGV